MTTEATIAILELARSTVAQGWTQYTMARDSVDNAVPPEHDLATCWCAAGAIKRAVIKLGLGTTAYLVGRNATAYLAARDALESVIPDFSITNYNDYEGRTQAEVLRAFDHAIIKLGETHAV